MLGTVVIVNDYAYVNGGAGWVALSTAKALKKKGYRVILFSGVGPIDVGLVELGIEVVCLGISDILHEKNRLYAFCQGLWNKKAYNLFLNLLSALNNKETIIHFHSWSKSLSPSVLYATNKMGFHSVLTLHDFFLYCPNGGFFNYQKQKICSLNPLSLSCLVCNCDARSYSQKVWRCIRQFIQNRVVRKMNNLTCISISDLSSRIFNESDWHEKVSNIRINNPIETKFTTEYVSIEKNETYLFIARLSLEKGLDLFCDAISQLGLKGCVLGDGYLLESYRQKYPTIEFAGWVSGEDKKYYYQSAKAFIFTSRWYETFGLVVAEMKSYGIPCIVPDRCAASEQIEEGKTVYIFESGNLESLKECICKYEQTDIIKLQNNILDISTSQKYSMEEHIKVLLNVYEGILL